jgi:hypothetical protein
MPGTRGSKNVIIIAKKKDRKFITWYLRGINKSNEMRTEIETVRKVREKIFGASRINQPTAGQNERPDLAKE